MKTSIILLFILLLSAGQLSAQDKFVGRWENADKSFVVSIYEYDLQYYATIINSNIHEEIGTLVMMQMEKKSENRLYGGTYQKNGSAREYEATLKLINADTIRMKILSGFFSETVVWHRVKDINQQNPKANLALQRI